MANDCIEEVILGNSEPRTSGDTAENQTPEEILPTDGVHLEEIPTFSDYDSQSDSDDKVYEKL